MANRRKKHPLHWWWTFLSLAAGVSVFITMLTATALNKDAIVALVMLGGLFFTCGFYGLGWLTSAPYKIGKPLKAGVLLLIIWVGMISLAVNIWPPPPSPLFWVASVRPEYLKEGEKPEVRIAIFNDAHRVIRCRAAFSATLVRDIPNYESLWSEERKNWEKLRHVNASNPNVVFQHSLIPKSQTTLVLTTEHVLKASEMELLRDHKAALYFMTIITAEDDPSRRSVESCFYTFDNGAVVYCHEGHNGPGELR